MAANRVQTGLRIEEMTYAKAKAICTAEHRSLNNLVEYALQQYISSYEKEHGSIQIQPDDLYE
ncbi:hypothetical protein [Flavonifractor plautii]|uniref:hypothetical protein n=1 Tax=Flavonifractor plautii TaxID=292800 RepID=UPI0024BA8603|nr:hypothetical protein [Flavonifractor plautii]